MQMSRHFSKPVAQILALIFFCMSVFIPTAQASMVTTDSLLQAQQSQWNKAELSGLIERDEVKNQLQTMGVDVDDVQARIDALTDEEINQMATNLNQLPAGGDILGIALTIFIVFVITDLLGATNIFPFIKSIR